MRSRVYTVIQYSPGVIFLSLSVRKKALFAAFPHTIPVMTGYLFLGMTYGVFMRASGFPAWYPMVTSLSVFAGAMEFVTVSLLMGPFNPVQALAMALMVNARHLFYGLAMLKKYAGAGVKKLYLIFGLTDETFSVNCAADAPEGVDKHLFMFFITLLDHFYWFAGASLGGLFGSLISFSTEGIDFVMTAMFVVIFLENWLKEKNHMSSLIGLGLSALCLIVFGADGFIIPAMLAILGMLTLMRKYLEKGGDAA